MRNSLFILTLTLATLLSGASAAFADPYCHACPFSCIDLGLGKKDCSELSRARGLCCVDLTAKGLRLAKEQERALAGTPPRASEDRCPPGFSPSEQKCSTQERRHGCKDMRLPSGLGCVRR